MKLRRSMRRFRAGRNRAVCRCCKNGGKWLRAHFLNRLFQRCTRGAYRHPAIGCCRIRPIVVFSVHTRFEISHPRFAVTPPPAAVARLDSVSLPSSEKKPAIRRAPARADRPFKGIALILSSTVFLGVSDLTAKYLSASLPSIEIAWLRFLVFAMIMVPAMVPGSPLFALKTGNVGLQLMRGAALLGSSLFFISGLRYLPIAEASATGFVSPLFVTALSIIFLSEKVGVRRWLATAVGLLGVLIILRPGSSAFHPAAVFPIVSALAWAC